MKRAVLIFSGYNDRGIITFCRFCIDNKIEFYIYASSYNDIIFQSIYKNKVIGVRNSRSLLVSEIARIVSDIRKKFCIDQILILPSAEYLNRFLLNEREELKRNNITIPLCSKDIYEMVSDKYSFGKVCEEYGINIPEEYLSLELCKYPFVIKPRTYFSDEIFVNEKPVIILSPDDLGKIDLKELNKNFYFQEYIPGKSFYLLYYIKNDSSYSVFSQENLIQQSNGHSIIAALSSDIHSENISKIFGNMFGEIGFSGLIMIEVRFYNNQLYMIEANPRIWGPSQLILDSNMDLFSLFALENNLIDKIIQKNEYKVGVKYFWLGGIVTDKRNNLISTYYDYKPESFLSDYQNWIKYEVYNRNDTIRVFEEGL